MEILATTLISLILVFSLFNFLTLRSLSPSNHLISGSVAVLIPMRNEERNVTEVMNSVLSQSLIDDLVIKVLDDSSTDSTSSILSGLSDGRLNVISGTEPPAGWLGKNFALHTLASQTNEEYLVFVDADVRLEPNAIASSIREMNRKNWDYISPYPKQIAKSFLARLIQPLLQWSWIASLPLRLIENSKSTSTVVANGQFFIVKNESYKKAGGHVGVKGEVLDDLELARSLRRAGFRGSVVDGSKIVNCEMYKSARELIEGYSKSQWRAFGNTFGALMMILLLGLTSIYPFVAAFAGQSWAIYSVIAILLSRALASIKTNSVLSTTLLHPLAISFWIYLILRSLYLKKREKLVWRARSI